MALTRIERAAYRDYPRRGPYHMQPGARLQGLIFFSYPTYILSDESIEI